jgi:hypothetical protein
MKKLISVFAIIGVVGTAALMTGCGGGGHHDDNTTTTTGFAPASLANQSVTLTENGQSRDIQFATSGNTYTQFENGTTNAVANGTFQYTQQGGNGGQLILTSAGDQGTTNQVTYTLNFTSATAGTYTFATSGGQSGSGTFSNLQQITTNSGGGDNGGGNNNGVETMAAGTTMAAAARLRLRWLAKPSILPRPAKAMSGSPSRVPGTP